MVPLPSRFVPRPHRALTALPALLALLLLLSLLGSRGADAGRPPFDADRSFADLERQVAFGPRVPGSPGHAACLDHLVETLGGLADRVERQDFTQRLGLRLIRMSNVIARWEGSGGPEGGVLLAAHWDTRPFADRERDPRRRRQPIAGANDGASGVAVLLEIARVLDQAPPPVPVMLVLFDGEDYGAHPGHMFVGSRFFAARLPADVPRQGILLDMVGDRFLGVPREGYSHLHARAVLDEVYGIAKRLGLDGHFRPTSGPFIMDDHVPLLQRGLKVINLIDFNYGPNHSYWHTLEDTPDKCSPASLKATGDLVLEWIYTRTPSGAPVPPPPAPGPPGEEPPREEPPREEPPREEPPGGGVRRPPPRFRGLPRFR